MNRNVVIWALAMWLVPLPAFPEVRPHHLFTGGAVLQQKMPVPIWGTARDGEKVTVTLHRQKVQTTATNGRWMVRLHPMNAGGPYDLKIAGEDNEVIVKDVMIGEVWVCSGQSNMQWPVRASADPDATAATATDPMIRLFTVPRRPADAPETDVDAAWQICTPDTVLDFSAVAYAFARSLRKALRVPVGLIGSYYGGTVAEAWTPRTDLQNTPELRHLVIAEDPGQSRNRGVNRPAVLYNAMIAPLIPYAIRGVIWYQGESNATRAYEYRRLFPTLIRAWRTAWGQGEFPFLYVQLAPFMATPPLAQEEQWAELREAQLMTLKVSPRTAMVVITDLGDARDIHPKHKAPVGERLALAARAIAYGERIVYSGPIYDSMRIDGNRIILRFRNVGGGLVARDGALTGFTIAGKDRKFLEAQAVIDGDTVVVWHPDVPEPVAVRYGWANFPVVNLYNKEGLPASPFRTDDFPPATRPR
ncbi:MAG: sialate O-acetylesterase [Chloroherpetonaceae bacterium]|nr:sialate O-acetylesterase [Chthonomonadaceae bacterium]MDW8209238.1 sialate O-acetylesterase [Chloroherpetonaceae bacterium]